jgi:hypothetical protein
MIYPYLPKLDGNEKPLNESGKLEERDDIIETLIEHMVVEKKAPTEKISYPSIFARPLLFEYYLLESGEDNPPLLSEWKGILGIFAFANYYGFKIEVDSVDLESYYRDRSIRGRNFIKSLLDMFPPGSKKEMKIIRVENPISSDESLLIGGFPDILFFTPAQYNAPSFIYWQDKDGHLIDPAEYFKNASGGPFLPELNALGDWISSILNSVFTENTNRIYNVQIQRRLLKYLTEWKEGIDDFLKNVPYYRQSGSFALSDAKIRDFPFSEFTKPIKREYIETGSDSEIFLDNDINPGTKILGLWEFKDEHSGIIVIHPFKVRQFIRNLPTDAEGALPIGDGQYPYVRVDKWFSDKLIKIWYSEEDKAEVEHNSLIKQTGSNFFYIYPFKTSILKYFTLDKIKEIINFDETADGVKVTLRPFKNSRREISHFYNRKGDIVELSTALPHILLFPNFVDKEWRYYYCEFSTTTLGNTGISVEPYPKGEKLVRRDTHVNVFKSPSPFIALIFKEKENERGFVPIYLKGIDESSLKEGEVDLAIDFGSSNTILFYREPNGSEHLLEINNLVGKPLPSEPTEFKLFSYTDFIPYDDIQMKFPTEIHKSFDGGREPLEDVTVIIETKERHLRLWGEKRLWDNVYSDLKWKSKEREFLKPYFKQILLMVAAYFRNQGFKRVNVRWAYPLSFSESDYSNMGGLWKDVCNEVSEVTGMNISISKGISESEANLYYLIKEKGVNPQSKTNPVIVIDVGGGTSDMAFWYKGKSTFLSVKVSAGTLLDENNSHKQDLIKGLIKYVLKKEEIPESQDQEIMNEFEKRKLGGFNSIAVFHEDEMKDFFTNKIFDSEVVKTTLTIIYLIFGALIYLSGLTARSIFADDPSVKYFDIYLNGNGSKFFKLITGYADESLLSKVAKKIFYRAFQFGKGVTDSPEINDGINIKFSEDPKEEVVRGLLVSDSQEIKRFFPLGNSEGAITQETINRVIILGEEGFLLKGGTLLPFTENIWKGDKDKTANFLRNIDYKGSEHRLMIFNDFIQTVNKAKVEELPPITIDDRTIVKIEESALEDGLESYKRENDSSKMEFEPFFIKEFKQFLKIKYF